MFVFVITTDDITNKTAKMVEIMWSKLLKCSTLLNYKLDNVFNISSRHLFQTSDNWRHKGLTQMHPLSLQLWHLQDVRIPTQIFIQKLNIDLNHLAIEMIITVQPKWVELSRRNICHSVTDTDSNWCALGQWKTRIRAIVFLVAAVAARPRVSNAPFFIPLT